MFGALPTGYGEHPAYGASRQKCERLQKRIDKREAKYAKRPSKGRKRRLDRTQASYDKQDCNTVLGIRTHRQVRQDRQTAAQDDATAAQESALIMEALTATDAALQPTRTDTATWAIGGLLVAAGLTATYFLATK